jgi:hypothetical protein
MQTSLPDPLTGLRQFPVVKRRDDVADAANRLHPSR